MRFLFAAAVGGCGGDSTHGLLEGSVTLDDAPLKAGIIRFEPTDGRSPTADATIVTAITRASAERAIELVVLQVGGFTSAVQTERGLIFAAILGQNA